MSDGCRLAPIAAEASVCGGATGGAAGESDHAAGEQPQDWWHRHSGATGSPTLGAPVPRSPPSTGPLVAGSLRVGHGFITPIALPRGFTSVSYQFHTGFRAISEQQLQLVLIYFHSGLFLEFEPN